MFNKQAELDALAAEIIEAGICSELASQATQLMIGDGNADADIVFIGEAPGKNEDPLGINHLGLVLCPYPSTAPSPRPPRP